jgi:hypothetical protein
MPAARDISELSVEEQAKILRRREIGRLSSAKQPPDKIREARQRRYEKLRNMDKTSPEWLAVLASNRKFKLENPEKLRQYEKKALETNVQHRLRRSLRNRFKQALRGNYKTGSSVADLGCSIEELKIWLENNFTTGMTWDNYGTFWHIDHVQPLALFDLTDRDQLLIAVNFKNLQPLEARENLIKGTKTSWLA